MEDITVPEKYRNDFQRALDKAVELGSFSDSTLAKELDISKLNAAILIGFMDKYGFLFPSAKNEVKAVRISQEEWDNIDRDIRRYSPEPVEEKEPEFTLSPIEPVKALYSKTVEVTSGGVMISDKSATVFIPADGVLVPHFKKAGFLSKGFIYFGDNRPKNAREARKSASSVIFRRSLNEKMEYLVTSLISDIEERL